MEGHPAGVGDDEFGDPHDMEGDVDGFGNKAFWLKCHKLDFYNLDLLLD